jgi:hypothetical protein
MEKLATLVNKRTTRKRPLSKLIFTLAPNVDALVKVSHLSDHAAAHVMCDWQGHSSGGQVWQSPCSKAYQPIGLAE